MARDNGYLAAACQAASALDACSERVAHDPADKKRVGDHRSTGSSQLTLRGPQPSVRAMVGIRNGWLFSDCHWLWNRNTCGPIYQQSLGERHRDIGLLRAVCVDWSTRRNCKINEYRTHVHHFMARKILDRPS